jgi:hypothetical protein
VSENPKITPEPDNATLELFNVLTRLLDNFLDVGTEKIIEAMMYSSTSSSSSDHETMDTREEILTRSSLKASRPMTPSSRRFLSLCNVPSVQSLWVSLGRRVRNSPMHGS